MFKPYLDFWLDLGFISFKTTIMTESVCRDRYEVIIFHIRLLGRWGFRFNLYQPGYKELAKHAILVRETEINKLRKRLADSLRLNKALEAQVHKLGFYFKRKRGIK